jgi:hypothetical protein
LLPLEHRASVKLRFLQSYRQSVGPFWRSWGRLKAVTYTQNNTEQTQTDIHASSEIRTHDSSVWEGKDISCLRPRGHYDRPYTYMTKRNSHTSSQQCDSFLKKKWKILCNARGPEAWFYRYTSPSSGAIYFSRVFSRRYRACARDTQCRAGVSCDPTIAEYTHNISPQYPQEAS